MTYRCVGVASSITEIGAILYDVEFDGSDGSTLLLANTTDAHYNLGMLYTLTLDGFLPAEGQ